LGSVASLLPTPDAKVLEAFLLHQLRKVRVAVSNFTVCVDPFFAVLAQNPLLAIGVGVVVSLDVDLPAEVAILVVLIGVRTDLAEPEELALAQLPPGPTLVLVAVPLQPAQPVSASPQSPLGHYLFI
jgi:uncharacterized membrane protein